LTRIHVTFYLSAESGPSCTAFADFLEKLTRNIVDASSLAC
jgi:hypothetical protein